MTRVTNFGIKRTYIQAGFAEDPKPVQNAQPLAEEPVEAEQTVDAPDSKPPKKKRKRTKMSKRDGNAARDEVKVETGATEEGDEGSAAQAVQKDAGEVVGPEERKKAKKKAKALQAKERKQKRMIASEQRRLNRIKERNINTTCFACREKGHAAKDCTKSIVAEGDEKGKGKEVVGICYRCGSKKHTLSRCKKPAQQDNPLPFASCFVCSGKGHLASSCPQNKDKGLYPNGGCCKLCGDNSHLAKDCGMRKNDVTNNGGILLGTGRDAGADEDDFHTFKRRYTEVEKEEKFEDKLKMKPGIAAGAHSGTVKALGVVAPLQKKKVVTFF